MMKSLKQRWSVFFNLVADPWVVLLVVVALFLGWVLASQVGPTSGSPPGAATPAGPPAVLVPTLSLIIALVVGVIGSIITNNWNRITEGTVIAARGQTAVRGLTFTIRVDDSFTGGGSLYAGVNTNELKIRLRAIDVSAQRMQVALLHELIHAIGRVYAAAGEPSEEWVKALAQGLYQVFRDNPKLLAYVNAGAAALELSGAVSDGRLAAP